MNKAMSKKIEIAEKSLSGLCQWYLDNLNRRMTSNPASQAELAHNRELIVECCDIIGLKFTSQQIQEYFEELYACSQYNETPKNNPFARLIRS